MKIAFVGGGNMASALIGGLIKRGVAPADLYAVDTGEEARARVAKEFGIATGSAIDATLKDYDAIVLAVKPQVLKDVGAALKDFLTQQVVITIAAGIRASDLSRWLGGYSQVVRTMPNTPALIGMGVTGLCALPGVSDADKSLASTILEAVGQVVWFTDESRIDAVTALSGSGPAYVFYFMEAMQEAARQLGLDDEQGRALAVATFTGAAQLAAQSGDPASVLRERVTSKGGTTAAALASFDTKGVKDAIVKGILAADARAKQMGDELGSV
jgi:pyrroline-5-carboxylate reductase